MNFKSRLAKIEKVIRIDHFEVIIIGWLDADLDAPFSVEENKEIQAAKDSGLRRLIVWREKEPDEGRD